MNWLCAFALRLAAAAVWQSPGRHHQPKNRFAARVAILRLHEAAEALESN